jgi:hypothetical protein
MQPAENSESNRTSEIEPAIGHAVPWRVISVTALPDFRLRVTFVDGTTGEVDMRRFLSNPNIDGTIFEPLRDPASFPRTKSCWARFSGPTARISLRMRCMMPFANAAFGFLSDAVAFHDNR